MKEIFDLLAELLGFEPLEGSLATVFFLILLSVLSYIVSQLWISHSNHKSARREYEYARSQAVNKKRFDGELQAYQDLSKVFMELRLLTHELNQCRETAISKVDSRWLSKYNEAAILIGQSAPFINLISAETGEPECGVHMQSQSCVDNQDDRRPSLFLWGMRFLDVCTEARGEILKKRSYDNGDLDLPLSLSDSDSFGLVLSTEKLFSKEFDSRDIDARLAIAYEHFVNCSFCRIRNSDTGHRDARKIKRRSERRKWWAKKLSRLDKYNRRCPYTSQGDSQNK